MAEGTCGKSELKVFGSLPIKKGMLAFCLIVCFAFLGGCRSDQDDRGTVRFLIESSPNNLDLRQGTDAQSERIGALVYEGLARKDEHFALQPSLAASWERPDARTWVFHLRPGVHFHDGKELQAEDVAWSIRSMTDGTLVTAKAGSFAAVTGVAISDPMTVVVRTAEPDPSLLFNLSDGLFGVVERGAGRDEGLHPVGTGPFRFVSQVQDKEVLLERNPGYWGPVAKLQRVRFDVVPDNITMALELKRGSADVESNAITPDEVAALRGARALVTESRPGADVFYANFNVKDAVLQDRRVRQAIACAIDKPTLIAGLWRGHAVPAVTLLPPQHWAEAPVSELEQFTYDPARARGLLEAAGLRPDAHGVRLRITLKTSTDETTRLLAQALQQQMRAVGIELNVRSAEFGTFYADITKGAFQMYMLRWTGSNEDPDIFRYAYDSDDVPPKGGNRGRYSNPQVDSLLRTANGEPDQQRRAEDYAELQRILAVDLPSIPLWYPDVVVVHSARLSRLALQPGGGFGFLRTAELRE